MRRVMASGVLGVAALISATASCSSSSNPAAPVDGGATEAGSVADAGPPFQAVHDELFTSKKWATEGVVIQIDGAIVYEEYANGYTKDMPHLTYSVSKSIGGSLIGIAINDGLMKLTDSICNYLPGTTGTPLCDTTIEHLLHMSSGLTWLEDYGGADNVTEMLYGDQSDMGAYAASQPRANPANSKWNYSSGDANILALALKNVLATKSMDVRTYAQTKLFGPLGITTSVFEADRSGTLVFSSSWFATPRDMAKMGQLYLDDGMVGTTRVLPTGWARYAITPAPAVSTPTTRDPNEANPGDTGGSYGAEIWLNAVSPTAPQSTFEYPGGSADTYAFEGHYGQKVFVIPSRKMVIARVGNDREPEFDPSPMLEKAIAAADASAGAPDASSGAANQGSASTTRAKVTPANTRITPYDSDVPHLVTGFSAKEACSCVFVVGQTDAYCTAFGQQPGLATTVKIDHDAKTVTATYVGTSRAADFVAGKGCTLEGF